MKFSMKYQYHVITSFSRPRNFRHLLQLLEPLEVAWHLLVEESARDCLARDLDEWIHFHFFPDAPAGFHPAHWMHNQFLDLGLDESDRYAFLCDDECWEPGFLNKIDAVAGEVLICSMKRGDRQPPNGPQYGTSTLIGAQENLHLGGVGGEQIIFSGKIGQRARYGPGPGGDFDFIKAATQLSGPVFVPDAYVWFNYLEPGRWNQ